MSIEGKYRHRLGLDLGGTKIEAVILNEDGNTLAQTRVATPGHDYSALLHCIRELIDSLEIEAGITTPLPLGIGTPGSRSPATGLMRNCNSTVLNGRALLEDLTEICRRPVRMANDADCFALSESRDGAGENATSVFGVILGTGVGGGIVIQRKLLAGPNRLCGEWGHNRLALERLADFPARLHRPRICYCGDKNCVETWLSGPGMALTHQQLHGQVLNIERIAASSSDAAHRHTLAIYCDMLATALASVINLLDPELIVLGGGLSKQSALYTRLPELLATKVFSDTLSTPVLPPKFGDSSGVRGAAWLWPLN
ncbi:MAG: ROK family protein [Congregibacter sp.]